MSDKNTGGPAFPYFMDCEIHEGMSLRDYFAGKAITGTLPGSKFRDSEVDEYARLAYKFADAMLRARST